MRPRHFVAIVLVIAGTLALNATRVWATNVDVSVSSACVGSTWTVTAHARNTHDAPLHVAFANSVEGWATVLAPAGQAGSSKSVPINVEGATFHYQWSSTDGHLIGTLSDTITRPQGCGDVPATSTPPTTTCAQAIPVRDDCGGATTVPTTAPVATTTPPDATVPPVTTAPPAPVVREQVPVSHPKIALPPTCLKQANCAHVESIPEPAPGQHLGVGSALAIFVIAVLGFGWLIVWDRRRL